MKFIIRDDDLNYFSTPADIERWYADIFAQDIPLSFAAVPFVKPTSDVYPFFPHIPATPESDSPDTEYAISKNTELVKYLKDASLIEVLQHGCTHETMNGIYEYQAARDLLEDTRRGKEELERAFGPIRSFAPPHDWIGRSGIQAIEATNLQVLRGRGAGLRNVTFRLRDLKIFFIMLIYKLSHIFQTKVPAYPYVLEYGNHKELCSYRLEDTDVFQGLEYAHKKNGIFVVVTHVHTLDESKKERLQALVDRARALNASFVLPSAVL